MPIKKTSRYFSFSFLKNLYFDFNKNDMPALSAQLAYSFLFSIFPFLIFLFSLINYTKVIDSNILNRYSYLLPDIIYSIINDVITKTTVANSETILSLSMLITIWASSAGVSASMRGMNKAYKKDETRSFWKAKVFSLIFTLALALLLILTLVTIVLGEVLAEYIFNNFNLPEIFRNIWDIFRYVIPILSTFIIFTAAFIYLPVCRLSFRDVYPGAIFSTIGWILLSLGFAYYVNNFTSYSRIYGSIGGVIALLVWLYWSSIIILLGGAINAGRRD